MRTKKTQTFVREPGRTADPSATLPRIPVEICGVDALHAPFFAERRTRGTVDGYVAGIRVGMTIPWEVDGKHPSEALGSQDDKKRRIEGHIIPLKPKDGLNGAPSIRW